MAAFNREKRIRKRPRPAHLRKPRKQSSVPLEKQFDLRLTRGLGGSEYLELITSVEHCVRREIERDRSFTRDPKAIMDYLHCLATNAFRARTSEFS
jgi:hypothetical protein